MAYDEPQGFLRGVGIGANIAESADRSRQQAAQLAIQQQQMQWNIKSAALDYDMHQQMMADKLNQKNGMAKLMTVANGIDDWSDPVKVNVLYKIAAENPDVVSSPAFSHLIGRHETAVKMKELQVEKAAALAERQREADALAQNRIEVAKIGAQSRENVAQQRRQDFGAVTVNEISPGVYAATRPGSAAWRILDRTKLSPEQQSRLRMLEKDYQTVQNVAAKAATKSEREAARISVAKAKLAMDDFWKSNGKQAHSSTIGSLDETDTEDNFFDDWQAGPDTVANPVPLERVEPMGAGLKPSGNNPPALPKKSYRYTADGQWIEQ